MPRARAAAFAATVVTVAAAAAPAQAAKRYAFATTPVVLFAPVSPEGNYAFSVIFKTNRLLPERRGGSAHAEVFVGGVGSPDPLGRFSRRRPCYFNELEPAEGSPLATPRDGKRVTVVVRVGGDGPRIRTSVPMRRASRKSVERPGPRTVARIGCAGERPRR